MKNILLITTFALLLLSIKLNAQNKALEFTDHIDQYAEIHDIDLGGFTGLTVESWVKLDSYYHGLYSGSFIVTKEGLKVGNNYRYGLLFLVLSDCPTCGDPGTLGFGLNFNEGGATHKGLHSYAKIPLFEWVHLAGTWDGDSMSVFVNGVFDRSLTTTDTDNIIFDPEEDTLHIGAREITSYPYDDFDGLIDEVRIWDVARTESEIRKTMHKELTGNESGLYAYYKLNNEGTGSLANQKIVDSGPNDFEGFLGSDSTTSIYDPSWSNSTSPIPYYTVQDGDWDNNSTWATGQKAPDTSWARVEIKNDVNVNTDETAEDLYINSTGELTINASKTLSVNNEFIIKSESSQTGSFIDIGTISYTSATFERYLTQNQWHFIGIPVSTSKAGVFFIPGGSQVFLRTHIESTNGWGPWISDVDDDLILGRGYECWVDNDVNQDETVEFSGTLNTGNYTTGTGSFYDLEFTSGHGLNLISNPYPSALNANIGSWTKTNIANSVWVWDGTAGNYVYWNGTENPSGSGYGTLSGGIIPAAQGFFVEATGANPSLTLPQSDRVHDSQNFYKNSDISNLLRLDVTGNGFKDAIFIMFNEEATSEFDAALDVKKIYGLDDAPQLFSIEESLELSINTLPELSETSVVDLGFICDEEGQFEIEVADLGEFDEGTNIYLEDLVDGTFSEITEGFVYTFEHSTEYPENRFKLHFTLLTDISESYSNSIKVWSHQSTVYVNPGSIQNGTVNVFDLQGRNVRSRNYNYESTISFEMNMNKGIYIVEVIGGSEIIREKVYIK